MAQRLVEVCTLFIENTFGELAAQIFSTLASRGRSSVATLSYHTQLPTENLRAGLALLIQHHIVKHYNADEDDPKIPTYYHADLDAAYNLIRAHKYIAIVSEREGEAAGKVLANVFELGHASVGDLESEYDFTSASKRDSGIDTVDHHMSEEGMVNGIAKDGDHKTTAHITTIDEFHSTLRKLLDQGYLAKVTERSYIPDADYENEAKETVLDDREVFPQGRVVTAKHKQQFSAQLGSLKRKWEEEDTYSTTRDVASKGAIERSKSSTQSNKRVKLNGDLPNGTHADIIDDDDHDEHVEDCVPKLPVYNGLFVRVNFAKCTLLLRNLRLEQMVHFHLGGTPAAIFAAFLRAIEKTELQGKANAELCKPEDLEDEGEEGQQEDFLILPSATDVEVLEHLDKSIDISQGVMIEPLVDNQPNGVGKRKVLSDDPDEAALGIKVEKDLDDEEEDVGPPINGYKSLKGRNKLLALVRTHLNILAEHNKAFVKRSKHNKASCLDILALGKRLIQDEVDTMIGNRFSHIEMRIVRCLRERGKLEEKGVQNACMMRLIPLRMRLTFLQFAGICDSQEIPKDASRQPNRVLHLWTFNEKFVVNRYLHQTYQGMSRSLQRLQVEREGKFRAVIEKAERDDVKGREEKMLNKQEKKLLKEWRDTEEKMLVQVDRLDDLVGVLRDFSGTDTTLTHN